MSTSPADLRPLVVKVTAGAEAPERFSQGVTVAATALAAGAEVSLWLTGEATYLVVPGRAEAFDLPHAAPLADLRDALLGGAVVTVCSQCAARRDLTPDDLLPGARIAGAAAFVEEVLAPGVQALVY
ncbi:DsrE family protein [Lapillicoccus jejuensis]|uniref:Putative peroxiredoxin n=1 Tax=Lapillicoccus jejuensis TaxID=402171 RepID=A0A542E0H6_9MICO|nr:DsrE family protein [Lapillicoccus jejuensis]TQJ08850.1 putative peroxiredoxin [Lapillicoccus jejuensis]